MVTFVLIALTAGCKAFAPDFAEFGGSRMRDIRDRAALHDTMLTLRLDTLLPVLMERVGTLLSALMLELLSQRVLVIQLWVIKLLKTMKEVLVSSLWDIKLSIPTPPGIGTPLLVLLPSIPTPPGIVTPLWVMQH